MQTDLMIPEKFNVLAVFESQGSSDILDAIKREARSVPRDISTKEGRSAIASLARKIASSKVYLDDSGKALTEEWKQRSKVVDAERKRIREELDDLKDEIRKPLTDWENKEKTRVDAHENNLKRLYATAEFDCANPSVMLIQSRQVMVGSIFSGNKWEEFSDRAGQVLDIVREKLQDALETAEKREKDRAELEQLRRDDEARRQEEESKRQKEREAKIACQAAEQARLIAEQEAKKKADAESLKFRQEQDRLQRERDEQEKRAKTEERERKRVELLIKENSEKAKKDQEEAVRRERERIAAERKKEEEATQKREASRKHCERIHQDIVQDLHGEMTHNQAHFLISMIVEGKVRHVKIIY